MSKEKPRISRAPPALRWVTKDPNDLMVQPIKRMRETFESCHFQRISPCNRVNKLTLSSFGWASVACLIDSYINRVLQLHTWDFDQPSKPVHCPGFQSIEIRQQSSGGVTL